MTLRLTRYQPSLGFDLTLYGQRFDYDTTYVQTEVGFDPYPLQKRLAFAAVVKKKFPALLFGGLNAKGTAPEKDANAEVASIARSEEDKITGVTVKIRGKQRISLKTGPLAGPLRAMRKCTDDLIQSWGYEPAQFARLNTPPVPISSPETWIKDFDFPIDALERGYSGDVQFRLEVNPDGSVGNCHILYRTNPNEFADRTCKLLSKKAKFLPATDEAGMPVRWYYISKVRWMYDPPS